MKKESLETDLKNEPHPKKIELTISPMKNPIIK